MSKFFFSVFIGNALSTFNIRRVLLEARGDSRGKDIVMKKLSVEIQPFSISRDERNTTVYFIMCDN